MSHNPITFNDCRQLVIDKIPFSFNHVFADLKDSFRTGQENIPPIYTVYSYSRDNPILVFDFGREKWVGLEDVPNDKISQLHMSLVDRAAVRHWAPHEELVDISRRGLFGEISNPKYTPDKFIKIKSEAELLAEYVALNGPPHDQPAPGRIIEKIIIQNPVWYHKVVGMLAHNYATITVAPTGYATIYFFYDGGIFHGRLPKHISRECIKEAFKSPCIIDSMELINISIAKEMLALNGFKPITPEANKKFGGHLSAHHPKGEIFFDMREFTSASYSQSKHWNWWDDPDKIIL